MFDFGFSEILLTSAIALVVLGPERLPKVARQAGNWLGRARAMARQLSEQLEREVSADELLKAQNKTLEAPMTNRIAPPQSAPQQIASLPSGHAEYTPPAEAGNTVATYDAYTATLPEAAAPHVEHRTPPNE